MSRAAARAGLLAAAWAITACEGSHAPAGAGTDAAAGAGDAGASDAPGGGDISPPGRAPRTGAPLPPGVAPARRILAPNAALTGGGEGSCSHQLPASGNGDRWCVFTRPGPGAQTELWVINVSRASAAVPACDGSDPACLRLTSNVWTGGGVNGPFQPYANRFFGDSLVFYADALSGALEVHRGPAFAWRPGWAQARRISTDAALECWGHPRALLAHCVEDLAGDPVRPDSFELRAGPIADRDGIVLPTVGRVLPRTADGQLAWQAGFSPDGAQFALSSPPALGQVESLRTLATVALGQAPPQEIIAGVQRWQISGDGKHVYFLRPGADGAIGLFVADFPSGAHPIGLEPRVSDYFLLGPAQADPGPDHGVAFLADLGPDKGAFRLLADPTAPTTVTTVFSYDAGLDALRLSRDLRFTAWRNPDFRVTVVRHDTLQTCGLNLHSDRAAYSMSFLDHAGLVFWTESDGGDRDRRNGYYADPSGCQGKQQFAEAVYFLMPIADRGLVFADEIDDDTQRTNLKYARISAKNRWPDGGAVRVHDDIDGTSVLFVGADPLLLLFTVSGGAPAQQGTYLFGPVPL